MLRAGVDLERSLVVLADVAEAVVNEGLFLLVLVQSVDGDPRNVLVRGLKGLGVVGNLVLELDSLGSLA